MKSQILKTVACLALIGFVSSEAMAELTASKDGIEGYRSEGLGKIAEAIEDLSDLGSAISGGITPEKIASLGGDVSERAKGGAKSLYDMDFLDTSTGDRWLQEFYGVRDAERNLTQYLSGDMGSQLNEAGRQAQRAVDRFRDNAIETTLRATAAEAGITDEKWIIPYEAPVDALALTLKDPDGYTNSMKTLVSAGETVQRTEQAIQDFKHMRKDIDASFDVAQFGEHLMQNVSDEAQNILSLDAMRFMNKQAVDDMNANNGSVPIGGGVPTMDILNIIVGMYNLDSVYAMFDQNAAGDPDGAGNLGKTLGVQVAEYKSCTTSGQKAADCCKAVAGDVSMGPAVARGAVSYQQCCLAMTGNERCIPMIQQQKKECLEGLEDASGWVACDVTCKNADFGDLIHKKMMNGETKWDKKLIDDLLEECGVGESKWVPSPTVLTSAEMAAIVPETIKKELLGKK